MTHHPVKVGTMPRECVWLKKPPKGGWKVGMLVAFKRDLSRFSPMVTARIWKIGTPPEYRLYVEL